MNDSAHALTLEFGELTSDELVKVMELGLLARELQAEVVTKQVLVAPKLTTALPPFCWNKLPISLKNTFTNSKHGNIYKIRP